MAVLPQTALSYAGRGALTACLLLLTGAFFRTQGLSLRVPRGGLLAGLLVGLLVFLVWIAPEPWVWPTEAVRANAEGLSYAPTTCGWTLTIAKLCASAFIISIAEELFFRKWLVEFAGFTWMLVLFGVEHMRWDLGVERGCVFIVEGVLAGLAYGLLAKRFGVLSACVAHAVTNLVLGLYVIGWDKWFYW